MLHLYILHSLKTNRFYIGSTEDLLRRFLEHNRGQTTSTRSGIPWKLVFSVEMANAKQLEQKLKQQKSRVLLQRIINDGQLPQGW